MPIGTSFRPYCSSMITIAQNLEIGCEIITTHYDNGDVHIVTRGLLHGPWLPTVYQVQTYDGSHHCLPFINEEKWRNTDSYGECHPWLERRGANYTLSLVVNRVGWVADKESLRPQLQRALRTWHNKLTADLADAEEALVEALFKPL